MNDSDLDFDVVVIGAGAAGLIAAGRAAQNGAKVLVVEKMKTPGRKLLITGKGRCNISNDAPSSTHIKNIHPNGRYLKHAYKTFFSKDIVKLLNDNGLETTTERGNRIFPVSNNAADVLAAIQKWLHQYAIKFWYQTKASELLIEGGTIAGIRADKNGKIVEVCAHKVIICTGGKSYPATGSTGDGYTMAEQAGHSINEIRPALVPLVTSGNVAPALQGLSLKNVNAVLWINGKKANEEFGEMLFAHFGLTGPIILTLSRQAVDELRNKSKVEITIDLKPALNEQKLDARLLRDLDANGKKQIQNIMKQWLPSKLIPVFLKELGIDGSKECHQMGAKERRKMMHLMKNFRFEVIDFRGFKEAIITAGGVNTSEVDAKTMESKLVKGLFFAGEVLDLDANTGGYNLQIAWSTGWLAGHSG